ncbi:centrosomal protein of 104 kDa [Genypterus blacodes]|uniref:centrosomal protein of 104 kDa n=1 Tax=Genypterus blacodes TaxID=154954 RepID=UPI003F769C89
MPRKIGFVVVSSSGHEDNFSAKELLVHAPTVNGWRSPRHCLYPQHITLQLVERSRVRKLQLLAHQYLIPSKVEFHIGDTLPDTGTQGFSGQLHRLGYVPLSDNEKMGLKARELKSIHVDAIGTYLRLTFHKNHVNQYNHHNQVALVAINVLGDSVDGTALNTIPSREQLIEHYLNSTQLEVALDTTYMGKCEFFSPLDDLAFDMYQDPEVAFIIRLLDHKKQDLVNQEKYKQARNLKQAIADLQKVGERLARYEVEKCCAIEKEDYDLAQKKKDQIQEYRMSVYQQLEAHNLLDMKTITKATESSVAQEPTSLLPSPTHHTDNMKPHNSSETLIKKKKAKIPQNQLSEPVSVAPKTSNQPVTALTPPAVPKIDVTCVLYDERPLPALHRKDPPVKATPSPAEDSSPQPDIQRTSESPRQTEEPEPLTDTAQREASLPIEVYGEGLVARVYSKSWSFREEALLVLYNKLLDVSPTTPKEELRNMIRAAVFLVKKALSDQVFSVFQASLNLLRLLLTKVIPGLRLGRVQVAYCLEQTFRELLARTGDSPSRLRDKATVFIQEIAVLKEVRVLQVIPTELVKPFKPTVPRRLAQSHVELLEKLLAELGTEDCGFTLDNVMMFCTAALEHNSPAVKEPTVRIILSMYQQYRSAVLRYLPPSDSNECSFLYKTLFDLFAEIDGKQEENQEDGDDGTKGQTHKKEAPKVEKEMDSKAAVNNVAQNKITDQADIEASVVNCLDNLCIFCGKKDESFTEDGLDLHYWKQCPMLRRCGECKQVVEIASLTEHLLGECESKSKFSHCSRCSEAVVTEEMPRHIQGPACNAPVLGKGSNHCPLCHCNFLPGEEAWKAHLMGRQGCKQNSRRIAVSQRTQPAQGSAAGEAKPKQTWSTGARVRPGVRGSRIPSLAPMISRQTPGKQ